VQRIKGGAGRLFSLIREFVAKSSRYSSGADTLSSRIF
jgi:hypothetical protein